MRLWALGRFDPANAYKGILGGWEFDMVIRPPIAV